MDLSKLNALIEEGYITVQTHPSEQLFIYNYTPKTQFERAWNEITLACRGLILDKNHAIIARGFPKFFNWEELNTTDIPNLPFEVFEKMDGSLGISYFFDNQFFIATRGSFTSDQSTRANQILQQKYAFVLPNLDASKTYLFEIIYPENRIVLDYGAIEDLYLLAIIDNATGRDEPLEDIGFPLVPRYDGVKDFAALKSLELAEKEGFVIKYQNGFRLKIKFKEYVRLHRILTQISSIDIWESLKDNLPLEEFLERVPDEFYDWVKATIATLRADYQAIETYCKTNCKPLATRKETAAHFQTLPYTKVLFAMLDERDYSRLIWRLVRPEWQKPFNTKQLS
jgi:tRNA splicing ligase